MKPVLYLLVRGDMKSLNPGKAMAQCAHAANQFLHEFPYDDKMKSVLVANWAGPRGYGTTVVKKVKDHHELLRALENAKAEGLVHGIVKDETYPLLDGRCVHFFPVETVGWVFGDLDDPNCRILENVVGEFPRHP